MAKIRFHASIYVTDSTEEGKADTLFREETWPGYKIARHRCITGGSLDWDEAVDLQDEAEQPYSFLLLDAEKPVLLGVHYSAPPSFPLQKVLFFAGFIWNTTGNDTPKFLNNSVNTDQYVNTVIACVGGNP